MTIKDQLEDMISLHDRRAKMALGEIDNQVQEEEKLLLMASKCTERIKELEDEILTNSEQITKLKKIVGKL